MTQSTAEGITIIDNSGMKVTSHDPSEFEQLPPTMELLWTYSQEAKNQCILLEHTLSKLPGSCNFPIIVGRRPNNSQPTGKENQTQTILVKECTCTFSIIYVLNITISAIIYCISRECCTIDD